MHKDLPLLMHLRENGRQTLTELSKKTHIPISTIYERLKTYCTTGVIKKFTSLVDFSQLGFDVKAHFILRVEKELRETLKEFLLTHRCINHACQISQGYDFIVEGIFSEMKHLYHFLEILEEKYDVEVKTYFVIDDLKQEGFLTTPEHLLLLEKGGELYV